MSGRFFDTNVLVYLASPNDPKREKARVIVEIGGTTSVQVLNEAANVFRRKMGWSWDVVDDILASFRTLLSIVPITIETHEVGLRLAQRYGLALFDAMIVAAAVLERCDTLWSEDMHHGLVVDDTLRIVNPFRGDP